ncbi:MAG: DNA repair protein RecN [Solirubrobacterales bacterium]|nr:DNA repair protein RecN [Solirubrobacterales bacterium]
MLRELRIENLLLIERAELLFGEGLNVLTGETGAGKTVLAHSLDLLMGGKAKRGIVRPGAPEAWVEGVFDLPVGWRDDPLLAEALDRLPAGSEEIVLGRRVSSGGRTSAFLGGRAATAADLGRLGGRLIAFYGQHEHRRLTIGSAQLAMVDGAGGDPQRDRLDRYQQLYEQHRTAGRKLQSLLERDRARERDLDLLRFELDEIDAARLESGERDGLDAERERLRHAEGLSEAAALAGACIAGDGESEGARGQLARASQALASVTGFDRALDPLIDRVESLSLELEDAGVDLARYRDGIEADPDRLAEVEQRLELIDRLQRKHGGTFEAVMAHADRCRSEIESLEHSEDRERELREAVERLGTERAEAAAELSAGRREAAQGLASDVTGDLEALAMPGAALTIELVERDDGPGPGGAESVEFMLTPNPGMEKMPLRDTASGGELSRVMLALAGRETGDRDRVLVFDEIDAGIGGNTAAAVGERLHEVAGSGQVIAITHLAQVASRADHHFAIDKDSGAEPATATVSAISGEDRIAEIRRMLGADGESEAATTHARELVGSRR